MPYLSIKDGRLESTHWKGKKLTPKMLSFINAYFGEGNFNLTKTMELSDYKCTTKASAHQTAQELLNHPLVAAEIQRRMDKREKKSEIKAEYLLEKLIQIIDNAQEEETTANRLRAIELAGKAIALWKERQEVSGIDGAAIQHEQHVKESATEFTSRILSISKRAGTTNVVEFPERRGDGGA